VELNVAMMFIASVPFVPLDVTLHVLSVPEQAPDQPAKALPGAATAVKVTLVPAGKSAMQVEPQLIPSGFEVTVPGPEPLRVTVIRGWLTVTLTESVPSSPLPCAVTVIVAEEAAASFAALIVS
jgi:hypothetical protein